jgi:hypothetical protein
VIVCVLRTVLGLLPIDSEESFVDDPLARASHLRSWGEVGWNCGLLVDGVDVMDLIGYIYYCITR